MSATFSKLEDGTWGVRTEGRCGLASISDVKTGTKLIVTKKDGYKVHDVELGKMVKTDGDMVSIWEIVE